MKRIIIFTLSALVAVLGIFYCINSNTSDNGEITVYISIDCSTVLHNYDKLDSSLKNTDCIPENGIILPNTRVIIKEHSTVLDLIKQVATDADIQLEYSQSLNDAYVQGINYLYEFSCGDLSGWMYSVNNEFAHVGCSDYYLKDGDYVAWHYTCNLGSDLNEVIR